MFYLNSLFKLRRNPRFRLTWGGGGMATHRLKCSHLSNCRISIFIGDYQEFRKHRFLFRKRKTIVNKDSKSTSMVARPEHCA